ncbi:glycosyltransferase family 4 protein [Mariniflexile litorale]|uniref:Glycosyltransferase family 4 protein n=1 Tax=Mariniflexile litorale TaxID=3045158 RepID=A0AAU7EEH5_9FLAO|nr:glycosyltransferase family 4 protein [Mariniflexile sp. KMM 9835]MDQ8212210.1 glycosyltransferase family 4 protein [Mariniflexile sp. KMM 9835]
MKILMVSIPSLHFFRWTSQLQDAGHEVYWFDITGMSKPVERIGWVIQKTDWKLRWSYPGRVFLKKNFPQIYNRIQKINKRNTEKVFEEYLNKIKPDVVHSFALYLSCSPIIGVMEKYPTQKWIYSSWGSDLYYFQNDSNYLRDIKRVLPRINYLFTDCKRDYGIAQRYGFNGAFFGVFPGGGGFDIERMTNYKIPNNKRKIILIKGFQGRSGRVIPVLNAIKQLQEQLYNFEIVVFGADDEVFAFIADSELQSWENFKVLGKIVREELIQLMGKSRLYIGNSNSDGIPNTLLESICMDVFPIQSNPGGATAEIIKNGVNGFLIENCENVEEIKGTITLFFKNKYLIESAINHNFIHIIPSLGCQYLKHEVLTKYDNI